MNSDYEREKRALCNGSFTFTSKYYDNGKIAKGYENANLRKFEKGEKRLF